MDSALLYLPFAAFPEERLLALLAQGLAELDLSPPTRVLLSRRDRAAQEHLWTIALGAPEREGRTLGRGFFLDAYGDAGIVFTGEGAGSQVFELRRGERATSLYLVSRDQLVAGDLDHLRPELPRDGSLGAVALGRAHTGLRAGPASLEGAVLLAFDGRKLRPTSGGFVSLLDPGIEADHDLWPTGLRFAARAAPAGAPPMTLDESMELLNRAGAILREGGDLQEAKAISERVLAAFPHGTRALALHAKVLERLGDEDLLPALIDTFEQGLAAHDHVRGAARKAGVGTPALRLAEHFLALGRPSEAVGVLDTALLVLHPAHTAELSALRARCLVGG